MTPNDIMSSSRRSGTGGPCKTCIDITKWLPVVFIVSVISWSYYAFVIQLCFITMEEEWLKVFTLIIYHIVLGLFLWAYWNTVFTNPKRIPKEYRIPSVLMERIESAGSENEINDILENIVQSNQLPILTRTHISQIRYCEKCSIVKPDRCHHCSVCGTCVLKMDHHCPWVNNCVCFDNYKFFVLFLIYAFLYCFVIFCFSMRYFIQFWSGDWTGQLGGKFHILFVFFVAAMFAISLVSLFGYHCYLISKNRSTLESFRSPIFRDGPDRKGFSLGTYHNFVEIFGKDKWKWFLPMYTSLGDGLKFPTSHSRANGTGNYNSIATTDTTSASGTSPEYDVRLTGVTVEKPTGDKYNYNRGINSHLNGNGTSNYTTDDEEFKRTASNTNNTAEKDKEKDMPLVYF